LGINYQVGAVEGRIRLRWELWRGAYTSGGSCGGAGGSCAGAPDGSCGGAHTPQVGAVEGRIDLR